MLVTQLVKRPMLYGVIGISAFISSGSINVTQQDKVPADQKTIRKNTPNIILILADDLGYGDLGSYYGGLAKTPNLNRLAQEGMLFTDFHSNGSMCSPTRAALLTGRYQQRLEIEGPLPTSWNSRGIGRDENKEEITIAEYLQKTGYTTGIFGKWHLGKHPSGNPVLHGFDEFRGFTCGCSDYFTKIDRNGYRDWWHNDELEFQEGYVTDVITDNSIDFINTNKDRPFFLYVTHLGIHFPWQGPDDGHLETRREGEDFSGNNPGPQSKLGPHSPEQITSVLIEMIEAVDKSVGRIIESLHKEGLSENTLVFFTSDNGSYLNYDGNLWPYVGSNGPLRGQKTDLYEGGHRVPAIAWWPGQIPALSVSDQTVMTFDLLPTFLDLLNIEYPPEDGQNAIDGISILPLLLNGQPLTQRTLFWRFREKKAVREGKWKLVIAKKGSSPELYNLHNDIGESVDLSFEYPQVTVQLMEKFVEWEKDVERSKDSLSDNLY